MSEYRLIDADLLALSFKSAADRLGSSSETIISCAFRTIGEMLESGELGITVDAVPREEHECLLKRFRHLLESDYIRSFDEVKLGTGEYKRDIREADRENRHGQWEFEDVDIICSVCRCDALIEWSSKHVGQRRSNYCPNCGAKMDGGAQDGE